MLTKRRSRWTKNQEKKEETISLDMKTQTQNKALTDAIPPTRCEKTETQESKEEQSSMDLFSRANYAAVNSAKTSRA